MHLTLFFPPFSQKKEKKFVVYSKKERRLHFGFMKLKQKKRKKNRKR